SASVRRGVDDAERTDRPVHDRQRHVGDRDARSAHGRGSWLRALSENWRYNARVGRWWAVAACTSTLAGCGRLDFDGRVDGPAPGDTAHDTCTPMGPFGAPRLVPELTSTSGLS